jgi:hypothetical protein
MKMKACGPTILEWKTLKVISVATYDNGIASVFEMPTFDVIMYL